VLCAALAQTLQAARPLGRTTQAWQIACGKRAWSSHYLYDPKRKQWRKVSVLALSVTHPEHARPLWLVVARLEGGKEPWYLLSSDVIRTAEDAWRMVAAYARRWQLEMSWRYAKSELGCESVRVREWERREKLSFASSVSPLRAFVSRFSSRFVSFAIQTSPRPALPSSG